MCDKLDDNQKEQLNNMRKKKKPLLDNLDDKKMTFKKRRTKR